MRVLEIKLYTLGETFLFKVADHTARDVEKAILTGRDAGIIIDYQAESDVMFTSTFACKLEDIQYVFSGVFKDVT